MARTTGIAINPDQVQDLQDFCRSVIAGYGGASGLASHNFSGAIDGDNATFVLDAQPAGAAALWVFWNGMKQPIGSFSLSGASVTLDPAPKPGDTLEFYF